MIDDPRLSISFADESGDDESRWIQLEQVALPDEGVTMEQAAELIDALYGVNPCEDGLGNGGEAADEEALPEEAEFLETARERLGLDICDESAAATWEAEVDVFRSHQDDGYSLQGVRVEVGETTPMSRTVTETVEMDGASCDLQWPYGGDISVSGGATVKEVRGSTVNFAAPVKGRVRIRYRAEWDRVSLTVRKGVENALGIGSQAGGILAVAGGASSSSREEDAASVVAFWRDLAAECSLTRPPEDDQNIDAAEIERLCKGPDTDWHVAGECWKTVEKYNLCNCSGEEAPDAPEPEDVDAPCPEGVRPGSFLGVVREFGEYVDCEGEDREGLNDPEFFRRRCCEKEPYSPLPRCRETREQYRGGKEIENGPEHWKNIYGENVRLTAVTPEGGACGELVKIWAVPEAEDGPPVLPELLQVSKNQTFSITVLSGGRPPFTWLTPHHVAHIGTAGMGFIGIFRADNEFGTGEIVALDACGRKSNPCLLGSCAWETVRKENIPPGLRFSSLDLPESFIHFMWGQDLEWFRREYPDGMMDVYANWLDIELVSSAMASATHNGRMFVGRCNFLAAPKSYADYWRAEGQNDCVGKTIIDKLLEAMAKGFQWEGDCVGCWGRYEWSRVDAEKVYVKYARRNEPIERWWAAKLGAVYEYVCD